MCQDGRGNLGRLSSSQLQESITVSAANTQHKDSLGHERLEGPHKFQGHIHTTGMQGTSHTRTHIYKHSHHVPLHSVTE